MIQKRTAGKAGLEEKAVKKKGKMENEKKKGKMENEKKKGKMENELYLDTSEDEEVTMEDLKRLYKKSVFGVGLLIQKKLESKEVKDTKRKEVKDTGEEVKLTRKMKKAQQKEQMEVVREKLPKNKKRNLKKARQRKRKQEEKRAKMREEKQQEKEDDKEEEDEEEEEVEEEEEDEEEEEVEEEEEDEEEEIEEEENVEEEEHIEEETMTLEGELLKMYRHRKALRDSRCLCITLDSSRAKVNFPDAVSVRFKMIGMVRMCFVEYRSAMEADLKKYEIKRMEGINSVQFAGTDKEENRPIIVNPYQLYVEGLPLDPQRQDLENLFPTASKILRRKRESFANIVFEDKAEAEKVFRESGVVTMRGAKLTVLYSSKKKSQVTKKNSVRHDLYKRKVEDYKRKMTRKLRQLNTK